mgnify:CR=1 FL=1
MPNRESNIMHRIQVAASRAGTTVFRNNVGFCEHCRIRYGLYPGSSDLIGWTPITITAEHVGRPVAIFTAIECKTTTGVVSAAQEHFLQTVASAGGIAIVTRGECDEKYLEHPRFGTVRRIQAH